MATPTLDEIEAAANRIATRKSEWAPEMYPEITAELMRGLVAHVRALENVTRMSDQAALDRITVMGARIGSLERRVESLTGFAVKDVERIAALGAKVAALAGPVIPVDLSEIHAELDRLRAENAELRKVNANVHHVAAEYEERIAALEERDRLRTKTVEEQPQWPAPQPIETAPLGEILAGPAPNGFAWAPERPLAGCSLESWRTQLREAERRWWLHMPPPPGGGK